jgi:hypothetical protein
MEKQENKRMLTFTLYKNKKTYLTEEFNLLFPPMAT